MPCRAVTDKFGTTFIVPEDNRRKTPDGHQLPSSPALEVWWSNRFNKEYRDEVLLICQANDARRNDVVQLTLGQLFDLIHALGLAVVRR